MIVQSSEMSLHSNVVAVIKMVDILPSDKVGVPSVLVSIPDLSGREPRANQDVRIKSIRVNVGLTSLKRLTPRRGFLCSATGLVRDGRSPCRNQRRGSSRKIGHVRVLGLSSAMSSAESVKRARGSRRSSTCVGEEDELAVAGGRPCPGHW